MKLKNRLRGVTYSFRDVKDVLAKANEEKSGDVGAGIAAASASERVAAKIVLSELTLEDLRKNPVVPYEEDEVTRVIDDMVNEPVYQEIKGWTVSQLREYLLDDCATGDEITRISRGLTAEMVAGVGKLCSNLDIMYVLSKIRIISSSNTTLGLPGRLSNRLQPNDPTDNHDSILAQIYDGLSFGCGDAVIGINPCIDEVDNLAALTNLIQDVIDKFEIPAQSCVLGHITNQMKALEKGLSRPGLFFQSLAGTEDGNKAFGIDVKMLDEAHEMIKKLGYAKGPNFMYFETGQGAELSSNAHHDADQMTLEARCYGLAKRYSPLLVNTVVGFIGPEYLYDAHQITRAGLEDEFCGKLIGIAHGCDACYTNHANADQNDIENLAVLLSASGCLYFMGVPMGDDPMLNYQCTSYHDGAALRQMLNLRPAPEFENWLEKMGLMENGKLTRKAGDFSLFLKV